MKTLLPYLIFFLVIVGCKKDDKLTFETIQHTDETCADCPQVSISIPNALEDTRIANTINNALQEEIISLLTFDDEVEASDIESAINSFQLGFLDLKQKYPDESAIWEAKINGDIAYEDKNILTIKLNSYLFTGGAHGYTTTRFLNFNKKKGTELENWQLFSNRDNFRHFAEAKFREQEHIPEDKPINYTGFMFERDTFYLPENIGFTKEGLQLMYEQYEVASYADGPIVLTLPFNEVRKYLAPKVKS